MRSCYVFQLLMAWGTADEVGTGVSSRPKPYLITSPTQVNCPKAGVAFYNKLDIKDKKLIEYEVRILSH